MNSFGPAAPQAQDPRFRSRLQRCSTSPLSNHSNGLPERPRELGLGGRRVLVSSDRAGTSLTEHKADRATVVREARLSAGVVTPEIERLAADLRASDGLPRYVWTDPRGPT